MLAALVILFREVLEAGLIIGVVLAASRGVEGRGRAIALGIAAGIAGSMVVAAFASQLSNAFDGRGLEIFSAAILILAVIMLTWHVVWMAEHGREMAQKLKALGRSVATGDLPVTALGVAVAMAVMREGSEVVLFLSGILMQSTESAMSMLAGSLGGIALGAVVSAVLYLGLSAIPIKQLFSATGAIVTLVAAGLAAEAVHQLVNAGLLPGTFDVTLWDSSWLLSQDSLFGQVLHVLAGYRDKPTALELMAYAATVIGIYTLSKKPWRVAAPTAAVR